MAGELAIRSDRFQAFVSDRSVDLTRREFELIELLAGAEGRVLEREEIYQRVGLCDGPRGPFGGRLRAEAAPEARERPRRSGATSTRTSASYRFAPELADSGSLPLEDLVPAAGPAMRVGERELAGDPALYYRVALFSLGDRYRGLLYGAVGAAVFAMAARERTRSTWSTGTTASTGSDGQGRRGSRVVDAGCGSRCWGVSSD